MNAMHNTRRFAAGAIIGTIMLGGFFSQSLKVAPVSADSANPTPQQLYSEKCSACHNLFDPSAQAKTAAQWQATVDRMLNRHGASNSISPAQAQTIVAYLDTFAVKPQLPGRRGFRGRGFLDNSDVWATDPIYSHVYDFRSPEIATPFRPLSSRWSVRDLSTGPQLTLAAKSGASPALLLAPPQSARGDMQLEAEFRPASPPPGSAAAPSPVNFGIAFDVNGGNYDLVSYDDVKRELTLTQYQNAARTVLQTIPISSGLTSMPDDWHKLRVSVIGARVKVWLDYDKKMDATLPQAPGAGANGLWTGSRAAVKSFVVDVYPPTQHAASPTA